MLRPDFIWLIPPIIIGLIQILIWSRLPEAKKEDTEISGDYGEFEILRMVYVDYFFYFIIVLQFVFPLLPIFQEGFSLIVLRFSGYVLILLSVFTSLSGLKDLGNNWTALDEYRIKKGQVLVGSGIYRFVRHPIYLAVILEFCGFELVANSWLVIPFFIFLFTFMKWHIKNEEALLKKKFGQEFVTYKRKTKNFIPFIY